MEASSIKRMDPKVLTIQVRARGLESVEGNGVLPRQLTSIDLSSEMGLITPSLTYSHFFRLFSSLHIFEDPIDLKVSDDEKNSKYIDIFIKIFE
jgi:hypothetical protein